MPEIRLNVPSRLKGIETRIITGSEAELPDDAVGLNVPSRLKGIETCTTRCGIKLQRVHESECAFPFEGN